MGHRSAIDDDRLSGHEIALGPGEEEQRAGQIARNRLVLQAAAGAGDSEPGTASTIASAAPTAIAPTVTRRRCVKSGAAGSSSGTAHERVRPDMELRGEGGSDVDAPSGRCVSGGGVTLAGEPAGSVAMAGAATTAGAGATDTGATGTPTTGAATTGAATASGAATSGAAESRSGGGTD